ncbi:MAG: exo-alpha-sialidase, partial [Acidobacteria bacterium]|nr:exo-alpha-sialidase [Acidobacteriota bacterium]
MKAPQRLLCLLLTFLALPAFAEDEGEDVMARQRWEHERRAYPNREIPRGARAEAVRQLEAMRSDRHSLAALPGGWEPIGPAPIEEGQVLGGQRARPVSGRVSSFAVDPRDPRHWIAGAAYGGVWRSTDAGASWATTTDSQETLAIGAVAFDPSTPGVLYAGTGEASFGGDSYLGAGLLKSTDSGRTWTLLAKERFTGSAFSTIIVQPKVGSTQTILAAVARGTNQGAHRSTNGGADWELLSAGPATDLVQHPDRPGSVIVAMGNPDGNALNGVYRSSPELSDPLSRFRAVPAPWSDFSEGRVGRISVALAPSMPDRLYVSIADVSNAQLLGLWYTDRIWAADLKKEDWKAIDTSPTNRTLSDGTTVLGYCASQCFYNLRLLVDRNDPD